MLKFLLLALHVLWLQANIIITNATIYTVDKHNPYAEALVIEGDTLRYVGSNDAAMRFKQTQSDIIDAKGAFIMPSIIDSHTHTALAVLLDTLGVNLSGSKGPKAILERLRAYRREHPKRTLYTGVGFSPYVFGPKGPSAAQLDAIFPDAMAFFLSNNAQHAWVNTKTLEFLGITKTTPDPRPGIHYYARNAEGDPNGLLVGGAAIWPHLERLGVATPEAFESALAPFLPQLSAQGITALFDAGMFSVERSGYAALNRLEAQDQLPLRYYASHFVLSDHDAQNAARDFRALQQRYNREHFKVSAVKFINDNSDDDAFAMVFDEKELERYLHPLMRENIDVMIHTSQDAATHAALNAIERVKSAQPQSQSRMTLAHVNMVRESDFERFSKLGVIANMQPFDAQGGGYYEYRYMLYDTPWEHKLARHRHFCDSGIVLSASSDYPVCGSSLEVCSPFYGIQIALTRQKVDPKARKAPLDSKNESLSLEEAIKAYTLNGAYQLHEESRLGSLEQGKQADLIWLDRNPFTCNVYELNKLKVLQTMVGGKTVFKAK